jgi:hypothetical protein
MWSAGRGWGQFSLNHGQNGTHATIELHGGSFVLRRLALPVGAGAAIRATLGTADAPAQLAEGALVFDPPLALEPGAILNIAC